ncbi:MAG: hypothetical protein HQ528_01490, partial [Candidatus Marinimicrobia bacterium]|nr:hypothetical protein [Candidatus Neomarinimicrobiota bacterium]
AVSLPIFILVLPAISEIAPASFSLIVFSLLVPFFVVFTHRSNLIRLRAGTENRFEKAMIFRRR